MNHFLDLRTLASLASFVNLVVCVIMVYFYRTRKTYAGFGHWVWASFLLFIGMILLSMRKLLPDLITVIIANGLTACFFVMITQGIHLFYQKSIKSLCYFLPVFLMVLGFLYFTYIRPDINARIVLLSLQNFVFLMISAYSVYKLPKAVSYGGNTLVVITLLFQASFVAFRILYTLVVDKGIQDFLTYASAVQAFSFVVLIGGNIILFFGFIIMNSQRLENELSDASNEITQLRGILPICSHCKKIRDDKGYWNQLEKYIQERSETQFSHGICPECAKKYYPDYKLY